MIVRELIEQLSKVDPELEVLVKRRNQDYGYELETPELFIQDRYQEATKVVIE